MRIGEQYQKVRSLYKYNLKQMIHIHNMQNTNSMKCVHKNNFVDKKIGYYYRYINR